MEINKDENYKNTLMQVKSIVENETDLIANCANISSIIKTNFEHLWIGFYFIKDNQLILGPFQGPVACTRIPFGKGVCGTCWEQKSVIIVPNVHLFNGHIACNSLSNSEIVLPVYVNNELIGVLDIDSVNLNQFDTIDNIYLEQIVALLN